MHLFLRLTTVCLALAAIGRVAVIAGGSKTALRLLLLSEPDARWTLGSVGVLGTFPLALHLSGLPNLRKGYDFFAATTVRLGRSLARSVAAASPR